MWWMRACLELSIAAASPSIYTLTFIV
jgi:hypothetical protein